MKDLEIYPSSWYYNACVQGFLEVLAWGLGENGPQIVEEQLLQDDGRVIIPGALAEVIFGDSSLPEPAGYDCVPVPEELGGMKRIAWWWVNVSYNSGFIRKEDRGKVLNAQEKIETVFRSVFHKSADYPNLAQLTWPLPRKIEFLGSWFRIITNHSDNFKCCFCGCECDLDETERVYDTFFTRSLSILLGNAPAVFPNLFWNGQPNLLFCKTCRSYFLCFHLIRSNGFFVNSNSFKVNWHLNHILKTSKRKTRGYKNLMNAFYFNSQLRKGVGNWALQGIEILLFMRGGVSYYPISDRLAKIFLIPQLSLLITKVDSERVWEIILREQFDYLPVMIYKSLRAYITGKHYDEDPDVLDSRGKESNDQAIADLIELYCELKRFLEKGKGGKNVVFVNVKELRNLASEAPIKQNDSLIFRLLELTRLNRKADVYHILLRLYVAKEMTFPDQLAQLFTIRDNELFKNGIYAFISGLKSDEHIEILKEEA